jgi:transcriptional regulator with XRE-family HTH domain
VDEKNANRIVASLIQVITEYRKAQGLTYEQLADKAGIHRTTIGLLERNERSPTLQVVLQLASALGVELSEILSRAEAIVAGKTPSGPRTVKQRIVNKQHFHNEKALIEEAGLSHECLRNAIQGCYQTLDTIDFQLAAHNTPPIAKLVELANISSMIGNLLGGQIATNSNGLYERNRPHTYPDLLPISPHALNIEIKIALDTNRPKGHLPKPGFYMTFRYVLGDKSGKFVRGKDTRGDTAFIWEGRIGTLTAEDFDVSSTEGDSGKTAVIKTASFDAMTVFYYVPDFLAYSATRASRYPSHTPRAEKLREGDLL